MRRAPFVKFKLTSYMNDALGNVVDAIPCLLWLSPFEAMPLMTAIEAMPLMTPIEAMPLITPIVSSAD